MADNKSGKDMVRDFVQQVTEAGKPLMNEMMEKAEPMLKDVREMAGPIVDDVKPVIEEIGRKAKPVIDEMKEKAEPATREVKKRGKKAAETAKTVGEDLAKEAAKRASKCEMFLQFGDYELRMEDVEARAREAYAAKGHNESDIKTMQIYIKPEERAAYYVVNHADTGRIDF